MRVPVTDLVGRPGATRAYRRVVERAEVEDVEAGWGPADDVLTAPMALDLRLESVVEGILVRGTVDVDLEVPCSRCAVPQPVEHTVAVAELYLDPRRIEGPEDEDGYRIDDDLAHLDLTPLVRDTVVMEVPLQLLCRDDCRGLCPRCGTNLNDGDCGHRPDDEIDPRWARLAELQLPDA